MNWLLDGLMAWGIAAPVGVAAFYRRKPITKAPAPVYEKQEAVPPHPRGGRAPILKFGFTLDGELTGEAIPLGHDPVMAAMERSQHEGKNYGARRV